MEVDAVTLSNMCLFSLDDFSLIHLPEPVIACNVDLQGIPVVHGLQRVI